MDRKPVQNFPFYNIERFFVTEFEYNNENNKKKLFVSKNKAIFILKSESIDVSINTEKKSFELSLDVSSGIQDKHIKKIYEAFCKVLSIHCLDEYISKINPLSFVYIKEENFDLEDFKTKIEKYFKVEIKYEIFSEVKMILEILNLAKKVEKTLFLFNCDNNFKIFKANNIDVDLTKLLKIENNNLNDYSHYIKNNENKEFQIIENLMNVLYILNFEIEYIIVNFEDFDFIISKLIKLCGKYEEKLKKIIIKDSDFFLKHQDVFIL